jgi:hypothetical protein
LLLQLDLIGRQIFALQFGDLQLRTVHFVEDELLDVILDLLLDLIELL